MCQAQQRELELTAHVQTACRALLPDIDSFKELVASMRVPLETLGVAEDAAKRVARGAVCSVVPHLEFYGEALELEPLQPGPCSLRKRLERDAETSGSRV